uniref:AlNc14C195G8558 protein n=1 Tax=Albugo laibachii Nc14 TaxID=890382 RepID=F0WQ77_9STRA|nr:AlNc14C195G8558 [Albugo laibachii Nc14]CCA26699.1 AlNc14C403G11396 [Albugo laibachii Nc14]|eukprot:CCA26699.1 AlNc14C403G11396 [Albugo laibachii Nc14]
MNPALEEEILQESEPLLQNNMISSPSRLSHTESDATQSNLRVTIVRVRYKTKRCLACYVLVHDVLVVSTIEGYVWMVEPKTGDWLCNCAMTADSIFEYSRGILGLQQVPLSELNVHLYGHDSLRSIYRWKHQLKSLPIHLPWGKDASIKSEKLEQDR